MRLMDGTRTGQCDVQKWANPDARILAIVYGWIRSVKTLVQTWSNPDARLLTIVNGWIRSVKSMFGKHVRKCVSGNAGMAVIGIMADVTTGGKGRWRGRRGIKGKGKKIRRNDTILSGSYFPLAKNYFIYFNPKSKKSKKKHKRSVKKKQKNAYYIFSFT